MLKLLDWAERVFVVLLAIPFGVAFARTLSTHPYFIVIAVSESLAAGLILTRKQGQVAVTPYAFAIAIVGTAAPLLIRPAHGLQLAAPSVTTTIMVAGLLLSIAAKIFLNRSFGIVAANRGVKRGGPYMLVRHPMYLGYIVSQLGFLLAAFSSLNLVVYMVAWTFQLLRIGEEERYLNCDPAYADFAMSTRWRLMPGLF